MRRVTNINPEQRLSNRGSLSPAKRERRQPLHKLTVEIAVNPRGLGYSLIIAQQPHNIGFMYAQLLWLGLLGIAINIAIARLGSTDSAKAGGAP